MNRTAINKKANREIDKQIEKLGIKTCEIGLPGCLNSWFLQRTHRHKRGWYYDKPDSLLWNYKEWCLACHKCHETIERDKKLTEETFLRLRGQE
jgi:hypothetical protein